MLYLIVFNIREILWPQLNISPFKLTRANSQAVFTETICCLSPLFLLGKTTIISPVMNLVLRIGAPPGVRFPTRRATKSCLTYLVFLHPGHVIPPAPDGDGVAQAVRGFDLAPRGRQPPPPLGDAQSVDAECSRQDSIRLARPNSKFPSFGEDRISDTAEMIVRYGITSADSFRTTGETPPGIPDVGVTPSWESPHPPDGIPSQSGAPNSP